MQRDVTKATCLSSDNFKEKYNDRVKAVKLTNETNTTEENWKGCRDKLIKIVRETFGTRITGELKRDSQTYVRMTDFR